MGIRFVQRDDYDRVIQLNTYCFPWLNDFREKARDFLERYIPQDAILGYYDESNVLSAMLFIIPFEIYIYESIFNMGGIASVASMPEGRHGGRVAELLRASLRIMKEKGQTVSMLGPFSYEFYRKYGWELGFDRMNYTIPTENLDGFSKKVGIVRPFKDEDLDILNNIYTEYAKRHNCCAVRNKMLWTEFVLQDPYGRNHPRYTYLWFNDRGEPRGYIIYYIKDNRMTITEMIYLDQEAKEGLLWFLFAHQAQIREVYWSTSPDERLYLDFPNPRIKMELSPWMMFRVVDVKEALSNRKYHEDISLHFSISISDPNADWNNKSFLVFIKDGNIEVKDSEDGELSCTIQTFSQIFTGYVTPKEAFIRKKLLGDARAVEKMERIFKKSYTFNNNPF
ncbi:MAG: GNAT family N-acetyltransferase [bacterium]|nr:GNAT family N-acetyltransferase [bacterium]